MTNPNHSEFHPKFVEAMEALERIPEDQRHTSPIADDLMAQAMQYAPDYLRQMFREKLRELGLLPEPAFYTDGGEPLYTSEQVAKTLGISLEEANAQVALLMEEHPEMGFRTDSKPLHRCH